MKKLYFILASLCLVFAVSSCSADDLNDNSNHDINLNSPSTPQPPTENGDKDDDKDKIGTKD